MAGTTDSAVAAIVGALKRFPEVEQVWLFGSRARGDAHRRADVDIAVLAPEIRDHSRWAEIFDAVNGADTLLMVDLVRLDEAPERLRREILKSGRKVYERDKAAAVG